MRKISINEDWSLRCEPLFCGSQMYAVVADKQEGWIKCELPCDVHMPLIANGIIKEPLEAQNCYDCEWVEQKSWWFKKTFNAHEDLFNNDVVELVIESLDSEADIFFNGIHIGHHKSAFYPFCMNIKEYLKDKNILLIRVTSGLEHVNDFDASVVKNNVSLEIDANGKNRGDVRRVFVRKPQYVYGWDWGPRVATCGITKSAYLRTYSKCCVRDVHISTVKASADAEVCFEIEAENFNQISTVEAVFNIDIIFEGQNVMSISKDVLLCSGINFIKINAIIEDAKLWWPNGMGDQNIYVSRVSILYDKIIIDQFESRFGIRTVNLNLEKINNNERKFEFKINGKKVFCKGANWIPADSIYARVSDSKYEALVCEAKEANFNMLRVWGGGLYERDIFYEKCDEYGIMIWHDFMFACAMYPDDKEWFRQEVEREIEYQTRRLRNHPSLVLWCGNNENMAAFDEWWTGDKKPAFYGGVQCYNYIAPKIVYKNCSEIPYWNSSPYGGDRPNCSEIGDRHHWAECTMNPDMNKRITPEEYDKVSAKFVSEYGYIGPCKKSTILKYHAGGPLEKNSAIWQLHNNTFEKETVPAGIKKHYAEPEKLDTDQYLLYAGLCQGLMYGYSLESLRFKANCFGSLFWMYSDCWGEVGWTIIDYYLTRKISYYFVKRAFAPIKLIIRENNEKLNVVGINDTTEEIKFDVEYGYVSFDGNRRNCDKFSVILPPHSRQSVFQFEKGDYDYSKGTCYVKPLEMGEAVLPALFRNGDFRNLIIPEPVINIQNIESDGEHISICIYSKTYAHAVHFNLNENIKLSDEYFDMLPGDTRKIIAYNACGEININDIKISCICK